MMKRKKQSFNVHLPQAFDNDRFLRELVASIPDSVRGRYLRQEILSKYNGPGTASAQDRRSRAIEKWLNTERVNAATNLRLYLNDADFGWTTSVVFLEEVRKYVAKILGPLRYPDVLQRSIPTGGASVGIKKGPMAVLDKLGGTTKVSSSAICHWLACNSCTLLSSQIIEPTETSQMFTVPKNSDIDRVAAKEPAGNMLLQRSVGMHIRSRLRRFGIDLRDQTRNQQLSRRAVDLGLATVDLSAASDSISRQLVIHCLPFEWYWLLDDLRVHGVLIDGKSHNFEMFSSMGNGFTFELESLLFYAICRVGLRLSGLKGIVSVYGDDIIVPSRFVPRLQRLLAYLGFRMNPKKTHYTGKFRESCGAHWYDGFDVKPFYVRRPIATLPDLMNILNRVFLWDSHGQCDFFFTEGLALLHKTYRAFVPEVLWGGTSAEQPQALVTGHLPRKRLVPETRKIRLHHPERQNAKGRYWFLVKDRSSHHSEEDLVVEVKPTVEVGFRLKPNSRSFGTLVSNPYIILDEG